MARTKTSKGSKSKSSGERVSAQQVITDRIVAMLEKGVVPWRRTWATGSKAGSGAAHPVSIRGYKYRGVNVLVLWATAMAEGYSSNVWLTFNQARDMGGHVRKGEKGTPVILWKQTERENAEGKIEKRVFATYYTVFNLDQVEGIELPRKLVAVGPAKCEPDPIDAAEAIVRNMPNAPAITHGGDRAYYQPISDAVRMPRREQFESAAAYYSTLFHELTHATGHASRVGREPVSTGGFSFGDHAYSREELVAEMGAAFLAAEAGIVDATIDNSAAYLAHWIAALKGDPKLVVQAASAAQKATDYVLGAYQAEQESEAA